MDSDSDSDTDQIYNDCRTINWANWAADATPEKTLLNTQSTASTYKTITTTPSPISKIDKAVANNRLYDEKLNRLEKILSDRLRDCRNKLTEIQSSFPVTEKQDMFRYILCGKPYFRDKSNFPAPDNDDTVMAKSQMYDFSQIVAVPGWTVRDKSQFITEIHKMSQDIRKTELRSKISELKRKNKCKELKDAKAKIAALEAEINSLSTKPLTQLALPLNEEYDWDTLANQLNRRHTAQEYQALWKLFFHPAIHKDSWTKNEHSALQSIAHDHKQQDWDAIAKELNTGRTGYQCFVYYRTNMASVNTGQKWTVEEVTYLKRLIDYFKQDNYIPWGKIAAAMENRSKIQIYNKFTRLIEHRKGRFLPEEDAVILNCVNRFGLDFKKITDFLPGRSMCQIRARYQVLSHMRISTVWSVDDDRKLLQIMSNQDCDMNFSSATKHFPGKNRMNIRSRYITLTRWMKKHPNVDIENAPRRGARRLNHGKASEDLNKAIENLKNTLKSEVDTKTCRKKITGHSSEFDIEDAIITTLINERLREEACGKNISQADGSTSCKDNSISPSNVVMTNLSKCLIFLESRLVKEKYIKSEYSKVYPNLGEYEQELCRVNFKSYSKKGKSNNVKPTKLDDSPNVWGTSMLSMRRLALPPNYATITGCKVLMGFVNSVGKDVPNVQLMIKRNCVLKEYFNNLMERAQTLFLWPMLLSNEVPLPYVELKKFNKFKRPSLPVPPPIGVKTRPINKRFKDQIAAPNGIDIGESECDSDITIEKHLYEVVSNPFT